MLHCYRSRWTKAEPYPASRWLEERVKATETLAPPAIYFQGAWDGVNPPSTCVMAAEKVNGAFEPIVSAGFGHSPNRKASAEIGAPLAFAATDMRLVRSVAASGDLRTNRKLGSWRSRLFESSPVP